MANEKPDVGSPEEKLKELERTLAKELDQQVRLSEVTDARLDGSVALNPTLDISAPKPKKENPPPTPGTGPGASSATPAPTTAGGTVPSATTLTGAPGAAGQPAQQGEMKVDDISLNDVDEILNHLDENFAASMNEIKSEISKIEAPQNLESISIGADYLKGEKGAEDIEEVDLVAELEPPPVVEAPVLAHDGPRGPSFAKILFKVLKMGAALPIRLGQQTVKELLSMRVYPPKDVLLSLPVVLMPMVRDWLDTVKELVEKAKSYTLFEYIKFLAFVVLVFGFYFLVRDIVINSREDKDKDPFIRSFSEVATSVELLPAEDEGEDLESPLKHPEYTVLIHRIVANLKPPSPRASPMITVELFLEASNQECAVEIHDREVEIKDIIERLLEQTTYEEIDTPVGKNHLKIRLRGGLNHILNKGRVRRIFFKSLNFHK